MKAPALAGKTRDRRHGREPLVCALATPRPPSPRPPPTSACRTASLFSLAAACSWLSRLATCSRSCCSCCRIASSLASLAFVKFLAAMRGRWAVRW